MTDQNPFVNSELTSILVVSDMARSKKFYLDILGAEFYNEYGGTSVVIKFLSNWILLVTGGDPTPDKPQISFAKPNTPKQVSHAFTIRVKNCEESYRLLNKRGVEFITPPFDWGYEVRCFFTDPDGHLFEISEFKG